MCYNFLQHDISSPTSCFLLLYSCCVNLYFCPFDSSCMSFFLLYFFVSFWTFCYKTFPISSLSPFFSFFIDFKFIYHVPTFFFKNQLFWFSFNIPFSFHIHISYSSLLVRCFSLVLPFYILSCLWASFSTCLFFLCSPSWNKPWGKGGFSPLSLRQIYIFSLLLFLDHVP